MNKNTKQQGGQKQGGIQKNGSSYNNNSNNNNNSNSISNNDNNNNNNNNNKFPQNNQSTNPYQNNGLWLQQQQQPNSNNNGYSNQQQQPFIPGMSSSISRTGISEIVLVPTDLAVFVGDPQFLHILLKIKEQSQINFISIKRNADGRSADSILIDAPNTETALLARKLVEIHLKQQAKIMLSESRLMKVQGDLFTAQGDMASGMIVDFLINTDVIGLVIGKKGARISMIEKLTGVTSVNIDGVSGKITVTGPDASSVQKAREMLELIEHSFDLKPEQIDYLDKYVNGSLNDIKNASELIIARIDKSKNQLQIIGTQTSINSAKMLLNVQLEYINKEIIIQSNERMAREQLFAFKKQYNMHQNNYNNKRNDNNRNDNNRNDNNRNDNNRNDNNRNDTRSKNPSSTDNNKPIEDKLNKMSLSNTKVEKVVSIEKKSNKKENNNNNNNNSSVDMIMEKISPQKSTPKEIVKIVQKNSTTDVVKKSNTKVVNTSPVVEKEAEIEINKASPLTDGNDQPKKKETKNKVSASNVKVASNNDTNKLKSVNNNVKVDHAKKIKESNNNNFNINNEKETTIVKETPKVEEKVVEKKKNKPVKSNEASLPTEVKVVAVVKAVDVIEKVKVSEEITENVGPTKKKRNRGKKNTDKEVI